jgi:hypothetical protein
LREKQAFRNGIMAVMLRPWLGAATLALALTGCGDSDENAGRETPERGGHTEAAEVGDAPTVRLARVEGIHARPPRPTVIASGQTARGDPFEFVLYGTTKGTCLVTVLPARRFPGDGGACGRQILPPSSMSITAMGSSTVGRNEHEVNGFVSRDVASVELSFEREGETEALDATTEQLPRELLQKSGARGPIGVFVAFLPEGVTEDDVTATAYDAGGSSLGTATWGFVD